MKHTILILLCALSFSNSFSQTYNQSSGNVCSAYNYVPYTFTNTPETPVPASLSVNWLYCGPWSGSNSGHLYMDIWIGGAWVSIADVTNSGNGCSWVTSNFTLSVATINDAINTSGGEILIRGRITDGCPGGVGCSFYNDPCYNATLSYDYAPTADFSVDHVATCIGGEVVFYNESSGPQETFDWDFGADAVPATAIGPGPHAVSWTTSGDKDISLIVGGNQETSTEIKDAYVNVGAAPASVIFGDAYEVWQNKTNGNSIQTKKSIIDADDNLYTAGILSASDNDVWLKKIAPDGSTLWEMTYAHAGNENVTDMILDDNGNIYLCGSSDGDYLLMKINTDGSPAWTETYDPSGNTDVANALCIDDNGALYVTGASYAANGTDVTTAKFDNDGNYAYSITEPDNGHSEGAEIAWYDGNIYIFGTMNESGLNEDLLLVKYETVLGIQQWIETINGTGFGNDQGHQMILSGSDIYLLGKSDQSDGFGWTVARYDLDGNQDWKEDYFSGDTGYGTYDGIALDPSGHIYLASTTNTGGDDFARVLQLDVSDGSENWSSDFSAINDTHFRGIQTDSDGSVFVSGVTTNNAGNMDICIEQIDANGAQMWWAVYNGCGNTEDDARDLNITSNNEAIVSGDNIQAVSIEFGALIAPVANFSFDPNAVCLGQTVTFSDASEGSALSHEWDFGPDAEPSTAMGPGPHEVTYSTAGTKTVELVIENTLGSSETDSDIEVFSLPEITTSGDAALCLGSSTDIEAFGTGTISWNNGLGEGASFSVSPAADTEYVATIVDGNGCSHSDTLTVTVLELPVADAGPDQEICPGDTTMIEASGGESYEWDNLLGAGATHEVSPETTTTYEVTVTDLNNCEAVDDVMITVLPVVEPSIEGLAAGPYCVEDDGVYTLTGAPMGGTFSGPGIDGDQFSPLNAGVGAHTIIYDYTDGTGCDFSTGVEVSVQVCTGIEDAEEAFVVYPNPTNGLTFIEFNGRQQFAKADIQVTNALGQFVSLEITKSQNGYTLNMELLSPGLYFVRIQNDSMIQVVPVVVR